MRILFLTHRYLGISLGLLMLMWCLSGVVMMYVSYPSLGEDLRIKALQPIDTRQCCAIAPSALLDDTPVRAFSIEMLAGHPILIANEAPLGQSMIDLTTGLPANIGATEANSVAMSFAHLLTSPRAPQLLGRVASDQWTVEHPDPDNPYYLFALNDEAGHQLYVSPANGQAVQLTSRRERFWNWFGAIPHWLYFTELRRNARVWTAIVVYASASGTLLALLGLVIGVRQFLHRPGGRISSYRGVLWYHHVPGLIFGIFALSWVASGLISMNPWGFLESSGGRGLRVKVEGAVLKGAAVRNSLNALAHVLPQGTVSVISAPLAGKLYFVATKPDGTRERLDATGRLSPLAAVDLNGEAEALGASPPVLLAKGDDYYFAHHSEDVVLPVLRLIDAAGTRYYLDPISGALLRRMDGAAQGYRWLHQGFHRLDFIALMRIRPLWDILMLILLTGTTMLCATGAYLGVRRLLPRGRSKPFA